MEKASPQAEVVVDANSPATKYETMLLEKGGSGPNEDKMILIFQILDQMIPQLGVFAKIMRMIRREIFGKHHCHWHCHQQSIYYTTCEALLVLCYIYCHSLAWEVDSGLSVI